MRTFYGTALMDKALGQQGAADPSPRDLEGCGTVATFPPGWGDEQDRSSAEFDVCQPHRFVEVGIRRHNEGSVEPVTQCVREEMRSDVHIGLLLLVSPCIGRRKCGNAWACP